MEPPLIEQIERATIAAVAPEAVEVLGDWLIPLDSGSIGRAKSAAPLSHEVAATPQELDTIEAIYRTRGLPPAFRIAEGDGLAGVRAQLTERGYRRDQPTVLKIGSTARMAAMSIDAAEVRAAADDDWAAVFLGEGFDPVDGAQRVRSLSRSPGAAFASVREDGRAVAVGMAAFGNGWASIHGMRTDQRRRGEGLAGRVLAGLARTALERGYERVFLQVEEANTPARALYRRAGLEPTWGYAYWRRPIDA